MNDHPNPHRHAPQTDTIAVWNTALDDDPGFRHLPNRLAPARTHAHAEGGVPWCDECEVHGHPTTRCPKRRVSDEHQLEAAAW